MKKGDHSVVMARGKGELGGGEQKGRDICNSVNNKVKKPCWIIPTSQSSCCLLVPIDC